MDGTPSDVAMPAYYSYYCYLLLSLYMRKSIIIIIVIYCTLFIYRERAS